MKLVKTLRKKSNYCVFCNKKFNKRTGIFLRLNTIDTYDYQKIKGKRRLRLSFNFDVHLSCGYKYLEKLTNPKEEEAELYRLLRDNYKKERILDELEK
jgi:hypothetical protein